MSDLEAHIVRELDSWKKGRLNLEDPRYQNPYLDHGSRSQISIGHSEQVEIHVGNNTTLYFEEDRFKPEKLIILAFENPDKAGPRYSHLDFYTRLAYQHPNGAVYSSHDLSEFSQTHISEKHSVHLPLEIIPRSIKSIPDANKLIRRNPQVIEEMKRRAAYLQDMLAKIEKYS